MKKYFLAATSVLLLAGFSSLAQDVKPDDTKDGGPVKSSDKKSKLNEYDEIIIKRKDVDKNAKVTIEIKGDQVLVDGKPIDDYVDDEVSVKLRNANHFKMSGPSQFRFDNRNWTFDNDGDMDTEGAFLGVMTEGTTGGARVEAVTENSGAEKAGLKKGDIITMINNKSVFDHEALSGAIHDLKPDDKVTITYKRDGKENKTTATLGKRRRTMSLPPIPPVPGAPVAPNAPFPPMPFSFDGNDFDNVFQFNTKPRLGIKVQDLDEGKGVKVLEVADDSPAAKAGLKEDDVITSLDGKEVNSAEELAKASKASTEKSTFKIDLKRNGKPQTIEVKIPKKLKTANL